MDKIRFSVDKKDYVDWPGTFVNQRVLSEYSIRADHSVSNDRSNARYLVVANIRDGLNVDLKKGLFSRGTYIDKGTHLKGVPCLQSISRWAVGQGGATIKEVFGDADFASSRGTLKRIASSIVTPTEPWTLTAQDFGGVILLSEKSVKYHGGSRDEGTYSGLKFEQYMTTSNPTGHHDARSPVDNRPTFELVVRSDLVVDGYTLKLCCGGELDALCKEEPIEIKCAKNAHRLFRDIPKLMQSEILGVRRIVVGIKRDDHILDKVRDMSLEEFKNTGNNRERAAMCYSFLFSVLSEIKNFLVDNDACRVAYDPKQRVIEIKSISIKEAKIDFGKEKGKNGEFITEKLLMHFNL